jgi:hypothetical protein
MQSQIIGSDRRFQVWSYTVGHGQLLLRATKTDERPTRIDVLFKGVKEFHLPTLCDGLSITEASDEEVLKLCDLRKSPTLYNREKVFMIQGTDFVGYVAALAVFSHEDKGEYFDPSAFDFDPTK